MISQSTDSSDPLGVLLKLAGAYKLGRLWRVPQIPGGFVATGLDQVTDGERQAWMAAPTRLTTVQVEDLLGCGLAQESEFRDIPVLIDVAGPSSPPGEVPGASRTAASQARHGQRGGGPDGGCPRA